MFFTSAGLTAGTCSIAGTGLSVRLGMVSRFQCFQYEQNKMKLKNKRNGLQTRSRKEVTFAGTGLKPVSDVSQANKTNNICHLLKFQKN